MKSGLEINLGVVGRVTSVAAAAALAAFAMSRSDKYRNVVLGAAAGLFAQGVTGFSPVNVMTGRHIAGRDTREALGGHHGIRVEAAVTVLRPPAEVYEYWRKLENLPYFMHHLEAVHQTEPARSHWKARAPLGMTIEWDAEIIEDIPPKLISWRSLPSSEVISAGSVRFRAALGGRGTQVKVLLQYDPPAGKLGAAIAWLFGEDASQQIVSDLRNFKQLLETGEIATAARHGDRRPERAVRLVERA
jgi:uncharacterized membrane protein